MRPRRPHFLAVRQGLRFILAVHNVCTTCPTVYLLCYHHVLLRALSGSACESQMAAPGDVLIAKRIRLPCDLLELRYEDSKLLIVKAYLGQLYI